MPIVLVIDDEASIRFSVRVAVPEWTVLEAADGADGLDLVRQYLTTLDLVVLDIHMPRLDGYHTCLQIRALSQRLPILPFTAISTAIPFLCELGCAPALLKPAHPHDVRAALYAACGVASPILPGTALLTFAQQQSAEYEHKVRQERTTTRVILFATLAVIRLGLAQLLNAAGVMIIREATTPAALRRLLSSTSNSILVAAAGDSTIAAEAAGKYTVPLLLIASTPVEAVIASGQPGVQSVVVATERLTPAYLAEQLMAVAAGHHSIAPELTRPFAGAPLTPREQEVVTLAVQGRTVEEIADTLSIAPDSVRRMRVRIGQKLGLEEESELRYWAEEWLDLHLR